MKTGHAEIRDYYRNEALAESYLDQRFREPLGALLHARQTRGVRRILAGNGTLDVLEIAPGPARLTVDVAAFGKHRGTIIDASHPMLVVAKRRLASHRIDGWNCVNGNAFDLPFGNRFDLVYTFRFLRHFEAADRRRLLGQIARVLRSGGHLVFDAVNRTVSEPLRRRNPDDYKVYDALLRPSEVESELREAGFVEVRLEPVQRRYPTLARLQTLVAPRSRALARILMELVDRGTGGEPLEWIVTCRRE